MSDRVYETICRTMIAALFVVSGVAKLAAPAAAAGYMGAFNVPGALLWPVIALEILGGVALAVGFRPREVGIALALFTVAATLIFHHDLTDRLQMTAALKNLAICGGLLLVARARQAAPTA
ncbi:DoxX family protein [Sphingomonas sp.]|jgi:putative oxidoreductase|uniref:DoxX family protein n=1 Tax=Sphingomonas sp. TaxID=28214 RepID=UPI002ED8C75C